MKKIVFLFFPLVSCVSALAQNDLTLSFMENIFQSTYINPAAVPVHKVSIGLPIVSSVGAQFTNTGFSYGDLIQRENGYTNDTLRGNIGNAYRKLDDQNFFYAGAETDIFHVRVKVRKFYFSVFEQVKLKARYSYPLNLMDLVVNGNGDKIGQDITFKNLGADVDVYRTLGIGVAKEWKHWIVGANFKYIGGIANMSLEAGKTSGLKFEDRFFAFQSLSDINIRSSGVPEDFSFDDFINRFKNPDGSLNRAALQDYASFTRNPGAAIDAAITYRPNDKWHYTASIVNFGFINWKTEAINRKISGGKDFRGFDMFGYFLQGRSKPDQEAEAEFKEAFQYTTQEESYRRWMVPQMYLTAKYNMTYKTHASIMGYMEYYKKLRPALTFSLYHKFGRVFNVVGTYSIQYKRFDNIGLGLMLKVGPCQLYAGGDNLVAPLIRTAMDGFEVGKRTVDPIKTFNIRFGMNLVFGKVNEPSRQAYESKK